MDIYVTFEEELKKNPELRKSDIQALRDWYEKQPHLPKIRDSELALFLHSNYYRMEPTKVTLDTFYTIRTHVPEFFGNRDPVGSKELRTTFKVASTIPLEKPTRDGYKVLFAKLIDYDPSKYNYYDNMKFFNMILDLWMYSEGTMKGHIILIDVNNVTLGHAARLNPIGLKKFLVYLQEGLPVRLKGLHFMNTNPVMDVILNMMKPFMKKELMDVLHLHSSLESLDKHIPLEILPNELGGKAGALTDMHQAQLAKLEAHRDWFLNDEAKSRVDESKRPGKAKSATDLFGVEGSFKKLDID
ncbi:hypothetical protein TKK_0013622 [Trichogramma kaykai]